jgi:hypothetical protein
MRNHFLNIYFEHNEHLAFYCFIVIKIGTSTFYKTYWSKEGPVNMVEVVPLFKLQLNWPVASFCHLQIEFSSKLHL